MSTAMDVCDLDEANGSGGVVWSTSPAGVHVNLVVLAAGESIASHVNDALDVVVVTLSGSATLTVDDDNVALAPHRAVMVPRGSRRSMASGDGGVRYLTIHAARPAMTVTPRLS